MPLVVFDLDGTLIDSQRDIAESANDVLASYGAAPLPLIEVARLVGEGAKVLVERALASAGLDPRLPDALDRFRAFYDRRLLNHTVPYAGIDGVLAWASARASLALLTNKPEAHTRRLLDAFTFARYFGRVVGGDSAFPRKPDPASLDHLMAASGVTRADTLFVGDSMIDVETARRARVRIVVVRYGFGALRGDLVLGDEEAAWSVESPADLQGAIARFLGAARPEAE